MWQPAPDKICIAPTQLSSTPSLISVIRQSRLHVGNQALIPFDPGQLVTMYRIQNWTLYARGGQIGRTSAEENKIEENEIKVEIRAAIRVVHNVSERLRRLAGAYERWKKFDVPAYFDLTSEQANRLVHVIEGQATVKIYFFCDLLLPSFLALERFWLAHFLPVYADYLNHRADPVVFDYFVNGQREMIKRWQRLEMVLWAVHRSLRHDISFLSMALRGTEPLPEVRRQVDPNLHQLLKPALHTVPTLTLGTDLFRPANRQPGRIRRLRRNRERAGFTNRQRIRGI